MFINGLLAVTFTSFLLSVLLVFLTKEAAKRKDFLISNGIPLVGGISMGLAFFLALFLFLPSVADLPKEIKGIFLASMIVLFSGMIDDVKELSVIQKFLGQLVVACLLVFFGVKANFAYAGEAANVAVSLLWIIGITNAINLLDVMDGLAAGASLIILAGFCVISALNGDVLTLLLSLSLGGAVLGFLLFNLPSAKVYMGNSGSHFLGLMLAAIALTGHYATLERPVALLTPVVLLGFPIFDTVFLILMRLKKGKSAFNKSNDHMALRFLKKGYSKWRTLFLMLLATLFFVASGLLLVKVSNPVALGVLVFVCAGSIFLTKKMGNVVI